MTNVLKKTLVTGAMALTLAASFVAVPAFAEARGFGGGGGAHGGNGGGYHGGYGRGAAYGAAGVGLGLAAAGAYYGYCGPYTPNSRYGYYQGCGAYGYN